MEPPEATCPVDIHTHLGHALDAHPIDAWTLIRAVRDGDGEIVDFHHVWTNATAVANANRPLTGTTLLSAYDPEVATLLPTFIALLRDRGQAQVELAYGEDSADVDLRSRVYLAWLTATGPEHIACQYRDITELRQAEHRLRHQAAHDDLTGLPNRRHVLAELERGLAATARGGPPVLVVLGDLDRFKEVNDTHGHSAGDEVLRLVSDRLRGAVRTPDVVARYGGDEFIVLTHHTQTSTTTALTERIREAVAGTYRLASGTTVDIGMSLGWVVATATATPDEVLADADRALYQDKARQRSAANEQPDT